MSVKLADMSGLNLVMTSSADSSCSSVDSITSVTSELDFSCMALRPSWSPRPGQPVAEQVAAAAAADCAPEVRRFADRRRDGVSDEDY